MDGEGGACECHFQRGHDTVCRVSQSLPARSKTTEGAPCTDSQSLRVSLDEPIVNYLMRWEIPVGLLCISRTVSDIPLGFQSLDSKEQGSLLFRAESVSHVSSQKIDSSFILITSIRTRFIFYIFIF